MSQLEGNGATGTVRGQQSKRQSAPINLVLAPFGGLLSVIFQFLKLQTQASAWLAPEMSRTSLTATTHDSLILSSQQMTKVLQRMWERKTQHGTQSAASLRVTVKGMLKASRNSCSCCQTRSVHSGNVICKVVCFKYRSTMVISMLTHAQFKTQDSVLPTTGMH